VQGSAGDVTLVGNSINGGSGHMTSPSSGGIGSVALWTASIPNYKLTVQENVLSAGTGSVVLANTTAYAMRGALIGPNANLLFEGNAVDGGVVTTGGQCPQAVYIQGGNGAGPVTVSGNRIHAGHCAAPANNLAGNTDEYGLRVSGPISALTVENNMIDGGQVDANRYGEAIALNNVAGAQIRHNTLVAGVSQSLAFDVRMEGTTTVSASFENNIMGAVGANAYAINSSDTGPCLADGGTSGVASFQNNLLFGSLQGFVRFDCAGGGRATTLDAADTAFAAGGATVGGNVTIAPSCAAADGGTVSGCFPLVCAADGGNCLDTVFAGWDDANAGYANLFSDAGFEGGCPAIAPPVGDGWALAMGMSTPPCVVAQSSLNDVDAGDAGVTRDLYGNCRSARPSMGAAEYPPVKCF
jgi:hypothetical protein